MSGMTQLILNSNIALPYTSGDKYCCYPGTLSQQVEMISGRMVEEERGHVQMIEYAYDYMGNDLMRHSAAKRKELPGGVSAGRGGRAGERDFPVYQHYPADICFQSVWGVLLAQLCVYAAGGQAPRLSVSASDTGRR